MTDLCFELSKFDYSESRRFLKVGKPGGLGAWMLGAMVRVSNILWGQKTLLGSLGG